MQFGEDRKLQPSEISELEKRGMTSFAGPSTKLAGGYAAAPYALDRGQAAGPKTRNQGTLYGERTSDGGDQGVVDPRF